jgi:hypothetical protein
MFPLRQHLAKGTPDLLRQGSAACLRPQWSHFSRLIHGTGTIQILRRLVHPRPDLALFSALGLGS